jgi:F-type H+-transporting ATPase subunit delta
MNEGGGTNGKPVEVGSQQAARVYAEALLNNAVQRGQEKEIQEELEALIGEVFASSPNLEEFFSSSAVGTERKAEIIRSVFAERSSELMVNFLIVLNDHGRLNLLRPVARTYRELMDRRERRIPVNVTSAVPLEDYQAEQLCRHVRETLEQEPVLNQKVDPELIGGLVIQVGDYRFDASVRSRIDSIETNLIERSSHVLEVERDRFRADAGDQPV